MASDKIWRPCSRRELRPTGAGHCNHCGRVVGTYIPKGGDGSQRDAYIHVDTRLGFGRMRCKGSKQEVVDFVD
jgi:hypothetical protein